jgi:hypothetical protein
VKTEFDMHIATAHPGKEPAEGSRETIDHELERARKKDEATPTSSRPPAPGDEAAAGTPGTGEDVCPQCHGSGRLDGKSCSNCNGSGRIIKAIGGA